MRTCNKCKTEKPLRDFYRITGKKYRTWCCKACCRERAKAYSREYYKKNREMCLAKMRIYQAANPKIVAKAVRKQRRKRLAERRLREQRNGKA